MAISSVNLASKFSPKVDERFTIASQAAMVLNNDVEFTGVKTVKVYSLPVAPLQDYNKGATALGTSRYGTPSDLTRNIQTFTLGQDKSFTFIIDTADKMMSQNVSDAGKALSRQLNEVCIPAYDKYVFKTMCDWASAHGNQKTQDASASNAYSLLLEGLEKMGNAGIPMQGVVALCSYKFANYLKQDDAFMLDTETAQNMKIKGVIGEVDGCKIVKVVSSKLPANCNFILAHPIAACGPKILEDYRIHDNPPGINGWLVEGRMIYDCFVLNEKADCIYTCFNSTGALSKLDVRTFATATGKYKVMLNGEVPTGYELRYKEGESIEAVTYDTAYTTGWTQFSSTDTSAVVTAEITATSGSKFVTVVLVDTTNYKAVAEGHTHLNIGE